MTSVREKVSLKTIGEALVLHKSEISEKWLTELRKLWGADEAFKEEILLSLQSRGEDLFSLLISTTVSALKIDKDTLAPLLSQIRGLTFTSSDLSLEAFCLLEALEKVLGVPGKEMDAALAQGLNLLKTQTIRLVHNVLQETVDVYEYAIEKSGRGFCQTDSDGKILYANQEMARILKTETPIGQKFSSFFQGNNATFVSRILAGQTGAKSGLRVIQLVRPSGEEIPVGAEVAAVSITGGFQGGYACLVDLSEALRSEQKSYEKSEVGIVKVDRTWRFTYVSPKAQKILGLKEWRGQPVRVLFPNEKDWQKMKKRLRKRFADGLPEEYKTEITRPTDRRRIPLTIAAIPETDLDGKIVGSRAILHSLVEERAGERIHQAIAAASEGHDLFDKLTQEIGQLVSYDLLTFSLYNPKTNEVRVRYSDPSEIFMYDIRWWKIPPQIAYRITQQDFQYVSDIESMLAMPELQELKKNRHIRRLIDQDLRSIVSIRLILKEQVVASLNLFRRGINKFSEEEQIILNALPLRRALTTLHQLEEKHKFCLRFEVMNEITKASEDMKNVANVITRWLVKHYEWENVSIFEVDEKIRLISQKSRDDDPDFLLPPDYSQKLEEGILGDVFRHEQAEYISDVTKDSRYKGGYKKKVHSECCLPILIDGHLRWLLNVEDSRVNAFSKTEFEELKSFVAELKIMLDRASLYRFLNAVLESASDAIIVTDGRGVIQRINHAAERLLESSEEALKNRNLNDFLLVEDPDFGLSWILSGGTPLQEGIFLKSVEGNEIPVLLSAAQLMGERSWVFIARDLTYPKQVEELKYLGRMYHEIATQSKTPLSLVGSWLRKLHKSPADPSAAETLEKALKQLQKVELTYDRLAFYEQRKKISPKKLLLDLADLIDQVKQELPAFEVKKVNWKKEPNLWVRVDIWQISFCIRSILSYLLRFVPDDEAVDLLANSSNGKVHLKVEGFLPPLPGRAVGEIGEVSRIGKTLQEMALGKTTIRRFIENHEGTFVACHQEDGRTVFQISLPLVSEEEW